MTETHSGLVHRGLRYSAYLRDLPPNVYVECIRIDRVNLHDAGSYDYSACTVKQRVPTKLFGIPVGFHTRSPTEIVELAISKIEEYDAVLETFAVEEEE